MIENYFKRLYVIAVFLIIIMMALIGLLFYEYSSFCYYVQEVKQLQDCYRQYCAMDKKMHLVEGDSVCTDDEECLKEQAIVECSPESFLEDRMNDSNMDQWIACSDQITVAVPEKSVIVNSSPAQAKPLILSKKPLKDFGFIWPIDENKFWLSSLYGPRKRINGRWGFHHGVDMAAVKGTRVQSVRAGHVIEAAFQPGYGNTIVVQHSPQVKTRYAHLHTICVRCGQKVGIGALLGTVGETGFIRKKGKDGSHLHFEVYEKGKRINPLDCLPRLS